MTDFMDPHKRLAEKALLIASTVLALICIAPLLGAQSANTAREKAAGGKMSFDVASVKVNGGGPLGGHTNIPLPAERFTPTGGLLDITDYPLGSYIA
jgi:hypothetical protein